MKPTAFSFEIPEDRVGALRLLDEVSATPVAGCQSLGPMLNLRLTRPEILLDISNLEEFRLVEETADQVRYGAGVTHAEIEDGEVPDPTGGWLRTVAAEIAHRAVRNRGTLGGSLCHADPAADWVLAMTALNATAILHGPDGERRIAVEDFLTGPYATVLGQGEILVAVEVRRPGTHARWGYWKFVRQAGDFAKASAAIFLDPEHGLKRCAIGALGGPPLVLTGFDDYLAEEMTAIDLLNGAMPERELESLALHAAALDRAREAVV